MLVNSVLEESKSKYNNKSLGQSLFSEMGDVAKQICRLCLDAVPPGDGEAIEETNKGILKILLIDINYDISDNAVACNRCMEKLQEYFDFKSSCFYVDDYIAPFVNADLKVDIKKVFQKQMMTNETVDLENVQICRLCMSLIKNECFNCATDSKDGVFVRDMIGNCLPEMDLNTVHEPLICKQCLSNIEKYNEFMEICYDVEQRIQNYCEVAADSGKVFLKDVLEFEYCDTPSQLPIKEYSDTDNVENDMEIMKCPKNEDPASIKCEDVDIKEELDINVEVNASNQSGDCPRIGKQDISEKKISTTTGKKPYRFVCHKCAYASNRTREMKMHMKRCSSDDKVRKCILCPFVVDSKLLLSTHMKSHITKGLLKEYGCSKCPFETNRKDTLRQHFLKHSDESEVKMFACPQCPMQSKYKRVLDKHYNKQHTTNMKKYECNECTFSSKHKMSFERHQLGHKNPEDIPMYKCEKCEYTTRFKPYLTKHMVAHEDTTNFKCDKCPYQGKRSSDLKHHMTRHSDKLTYRCNHCMYCTNVRRYLLNHMQVHIKESERDTLQCDKCDFQTKHKFSLKSHKLMHNPNRPTLKCDQCDYSTKIRTRLKHHLVTHMRIEEAPAYCCATCNFKTKYKDSLLSHVHMCIKRKKKNENSIKNKKKSSRTTNNLQKVEAKD